MKYEERVLKYLKDKKIITSKDLKTLNIPRIILTRLLKKNKIKKLTRGVYCLKDSYGDEYYELTYGITNAIYSYFTALYFHDLCERVPISYDITVPKGYGGILQKNSKVNLHYVDSSIFNLGRITVQSPQGQKIECYDIERSLCDIIKDKNKLYFEYVKYAFVEYYRHQKHNTFRLYQYAKKMGIEKQVHEFMEAIL